jgi:hypothetical protein
MYSPKHVKQMIVLNHDLSQELAAEAMRQELVHAVQDELFSFDSFENFEGVTVDEWWARHAIEAGFAKFALDSKSKVADVDPTEWSVRLMGLYFGAGSDLIERVSHRRETLRDLLSMLFENPPASTREVLHPELYEAYLDTGRHPAAGDSASMQAMTDAVGTALTGGSSSISWRSRLGEFGLQCQLVELGMDPIEASRVAAGWRNDVVINLGLWHDPTATGVVWCLSGADAAAELSAKLQELAIARGVKLQGVDIGLNGKLTTAHVALGSESLPDVAILQDGEAVGFIAGADLAEIMKRLIGSPPKR